MDREVRSEQVAHHDKANLHKQTGRPGQSMELCSQKPFETILSYVDVEPCQQVSLGVKTSHRASTNVVVYIKGCVGKASAELPKLLERKQTLDCF